MLFPPSPVLFDDPKPMAGPFKLWEPEKYCPGPGTKLELLVTPPVSRFSEPNPGPPFRGEKPKSGLYYPGPGTWLPAFNEDPVFCPKV